MAKTVQEHRDTLMFGGNREIAIQRDGEKCVKCGMTRAEHRLKHGKDITVDHIDKMGTGVPKHLKNNSLDNLQTLCIRCHASKDNYMNKLTDVQVINIRHIGKTIPQTHIAKLYGVSQAYISMVMNGKWRLNVERGTW